MGSSGNGLEGSWKSGGIQTRDNKNPFLGTAGREAAEQRSKISRIYHGL